MSSLRLSISASACQELARQKFQHCRGELIGLFDVWRVSGLGDRDTTCAIVGGVVALACGAERIPAEWLSAREPLRPMVVLIALTELRLLAGHYGVESIIKREPDAVIKLRDAQRVQKALVGAPGTLRIVDDRTLYFRPPPGYLEPETLLLVLRNLMYAAYQRELKGEPDPVVSTRQPVKSAGR